jgi:hypothetical protein
VSPGKTEKGNPADPDQRDRALLRQEGWITRFSRRTERKLYFYLTLLLGIWWVLAHIFKKG